MQPDAILKELRLPQERMPEEALLAAMAQPEAVIPGLLDLLRETVEDPEGRQDETGHIFALYLLSQFREPRALPLAQALLRLPEETQDALLGDLLTEGMPSVLASLAVANPAELESMAADPSLDVFVRTGAMEALLALGFKGLMPEAELRRAFDALLTLYEDRGAHETPESWAFMISTLITAGFPEFQERLSAAYARGLVDATIVDEAGVAASLQQHQPHIRRRFLKTHHPVEDAILDLEDQGWFSHAEDEQDDEDYDDEDYEDEEADIPIPAMTPEALQAIIARQGPSAVRKGPSRNAPCPCGSGKKYKRCCGKD